MRARRAGALVLVAAIAAAACRKPPEDPLKLEGNLLTVDNRTDRDWNKVEISVNRAFRIMVPTIKARSRFQAPLDTFVAGFGQRFDFRRIQIRDLRLTATLPDGTPLELVKQFDEFGLDRALRGGSR